MTQYCSIGKFAATFGLAGDLVLLHQLGKKSPLKGLQAVFIEKQPDEFFPYFVESAQAKSTTETYLKLEGISTPESARTLLQKQVWLTETDFQQHAGKSAPLSLLGYHVVNEGVDLGEVLEVIEQPHQLLCRIDLEGKEALIPVHADTLLKIDKKNRKILVELPEGLLDIFR